MKNTSNYSTMGLNRENCYGTVLNVSPLLTFNFQKHNPYYLIGILVVVLGNTYYEHSTYLWGYYNSPYFKSNTEKIQKTWNVWINIWNVAERLRPHHIPKVSMTLSIN